MTIDLDKLQSRFDKFFEENTIEDFETWKASKSQPPPASLKGEEGDSPAENAYRLIVGPYQVLTKKHALDMFKIGVIHGKNGSVIVDFKHPSHLPTPGEGEGLKWTDEDMKECWIESATAHGANSWNGTKFENWLNSYKANHQNI